MSYWARAGSAHMLTPPGGAARACRVARWVTRPSGAYPRGRHRGRAVQRERTGKGVDRRRVSARRRGLDAWRTTSSRRRFSARSRRVTSPEVARQRARRLLPDRRRPLVQPQHARSRTPLGTDVPRARSRRPDDAGVRDRGQRAERVPNFIRSSSNGSLRCRWSSCKHGSRPKTRSTRRLASPVEGSDPTAARCC